MELYTVYRFLVRIRRLKWLWWSLVLLAVFGFLGDDSGSVSVLDGTEVNTAESSFIYRNGDSIWTVDNALEYEQHEIFFYFYLAKKALTCVDRMLELSKKAVV